MRRPLLALLLCAPAALASVDAGDARADDHKAKDATEYTGGFRMEGEPKIETVFGDAERYKKYVDRFFAVHGEMQTDLEDFSRNVQAVLASLTAHQNGGGKGCPTDAVALSYSRAYKQGQSYHRLGKELEANYTSIKELDSLGETSGLTPDYRWKVSRAIKLYPTVLKDFKEMQVAFQDQLAGELKFKGCDSAVLLAKGEELEKSGAPETPVVATDEKPSDKKKGKKTEVVTPIVHASAAAFFVDNSTCKTSLKVFLDGALLGEVSSSSKAAFRSLVGRHDLCLIPSSSQQSCGDPGTLRRTYIHDGWSITLRCD